MVISMNLLLVAVFAVIVLCCDFATGDNLPKIVTDNTSERTTQTRQQTENPLRSYLSRNGGGIRMNNDPATIQSVISDIQSGNWDRFSAPPLKQHEAENPQCFIEVEVTTTQRIPGRCTYLFNGMSACQSHHLMSLNTNECQEEKKTFEKNL